METNKTFTIAIQSKAKNGILYKFIKDRGMTQSDFARAIGEYTSRVGSWFNLKDFPRKKAMEKVCNYMGMLPEDIFPEFIRNPDFLKLCKNTVTYHEVPIDFLPFTELKELAYTSPTQEDDFNTLEKREVIQHVLKTLTPKEEKVIDLYYGISDGIERTFENIGIILGIGGERVGQIYTKAMRKLHHPSRLTALKRV
jgi:RNA polymerase sigma factor (sigma-70 family)